MADRKATPDIMSELMVGQNTSKPVRQHTSIPAKQRTSKPAIKKAAPPEGRAIKATFYLSPKAIEALEQLWIKRRQKAEPEQRGRISKSLLVEEAIGLLK